MGRRAAGQPRHHRHPAPAQAAAPIRRGGAARAAPAGRCVRGLRSLAAAAWPDGRALPEGEPLIIISANTAPDGDLLRGTLDAPPPLPQPAPPQPAQGPSSDSWVGSCVQQCLQMGRPSGRRAPG